MFVCLSVVIYEVVCPYDAYDDPPTIGPRTIETMKRAGGHAIAIEGGKTIFIDREKTLNNAHRAGIVIVSQPS